MEQDDNTLNENMMERAFLESQSHRARELLKLKESRNAFDSSASVTDGDDRDAFWEHFRSECALLHKELDYHLYTDIKTKTSPKLYLTAEQRLEGQAVLDHLIMRLLHFEKPSNVPNLVGGDVRLFSQEMSNLKTRIEHFRNVVCPREKFTFKRYHDLKKGLVRRNEDKPELPEPAPKKANEILGTGEIRRFYSDQRMQKERRNQDNSQTSQCLRNESWEQATSSEEDISRLENQYENISKSDVVIIEGERDKVLDVEDHGHDSKGKRNSPHLKNLERCTVILRESYGTISFRAISSCTIYVYPVVGSIFLHDCHNCTISLASRQLRIHDSSNLNIHAMVLSGPIIEDCVGITFSGDYVHTLWKNVGKITKNVDETTFQQSIRNTLLNCALIGEASREDEEKSNQFRNVKDFNWHKVQKSPNFDVVEFMDQLEDDDYDNDDETDDEL